MLIDLQRHLDMFPMYVGMNRPPRLLSSLISYVPHVCGDEPRAVDLGKVLVVCSPCMWG